MRVIAARGICGNVHGGVVRETPSLLMSASAKARVSRSRDPAHMGVAGGARIDQDGNPRESVDSLIHNSRTRRLCNHVVDRCDNGVGAIVEDSDRERIAERRGGRQQHQRESEKGDRSTHRTHSPRRGAISLACNLGRLWLPVDFAGRGARYK